MHACIRQAHTRALTCMLARRQRKVAYGWVVKSANDGSPRATATGATSTLQLGPGQYAATLNVVDNTGASGTAGPVAFTVSGPGPAAGPGNAPSGALMAAKIASPLLIVASAPDGGNASIALDASGSTPSPGRELTTFAWTVANQQVCIGRSASQARSQAEAAQPGVRARLQQRHSVSLQASPCC